MEFKNPLIVVDDIDRSKKFYSEIFGLQVIMDFGANITLTGGISLQSKETWATFIKKPEEKIVYQGNDAELYFEEEEFDKFIEKLKNVHNIQYVHDVIEHDWGQRVVRFYDPDKHIIEVGEDMKVVCNRFLNEGLTIEKTAERMQVPVQYVEGCLH